MPDEIKLPWYKKKKFQIPAAVVVVLLMFSLFIMIINYRFPHFFTLVPQNSASGEAEAVEETGEGTSPPPAPAQWRKGLMTANTLIVIGDDLFSNWLPNDKIWPTIFLDNPQNFQLGALEGMRYTTRVLRDQLSRSKTADTIDRNCEAAFNLLNNDPFKWYFPSAESRFNGAVEHLRSYRDRLAAVPEGEERLFYARYDNLIELLDTYVSLLGGVNTRLANAPRGQRYKISEEAMGDIRPTGSGEQLVDTQVPWREIDDNFYYAQGVAYVIRQMMVAIRYDFADILTSWNATVQVDNIIAVLNQAQFEPVMVLNGDVGSVLANHSMELHSLLENSRQKMRNLRDMLKPN